MSKKKKLLFVTRKYPPSKGGMENALYNIAKNLQDDEIDVHVVSLGKSQVNLFWFLPYAALYVLINFRKYDYLILGDALMCVCGLLAKIVNPKAKRLVIIHGLDVTYNNFWYQFYLKVFLTKSSELFACNSKYTADVVSDWGIPTEKVHVIPLGIDLGIFDGVSKTPNKEFREKLAIPENALVVLTTGRLVRRKGVEWFISNVLPSIENIVYIVVGDGEEKENIQKAIVQAATSEKVRLLGKVSHEILVDCYFNSDVFVMPNHHEENNVEGFGLVALEASLAGLLVLASNVDGIPDAVIDRKNGFLLEPNRSSQYIEMIKRIQSDKEKYAVIAKQYQRFTKDNCSWSRTCSILKQLFDKSVT